MPDQVTQKSPVLAIDAGNSRVKARLFEKSTTHAPRVATREALQPGNEDQFRELLRDLPAVGCVTISCARAGDEQVFRNLLEDLAAPLHFLHLADPPPIRHFYRQGKPGADRLAAAIGLHDFFPGEPAISIDFGTATNTVMVNADGEFLGGAILPGLRLQADILSGATAGSLPETALEVPPPLGPPEDTLAAIRLGILLGHAGAIDRLVAHHRNVLGDETTPCLVTGGNADLVAPHLGFDFQRSPNLVLHGLACWAHEVMATSRQGGRDEL